ncbi:MAG TPA: hypothetical protein VFD30_12920 [Terriglobia bacterium]|nr:hypothetical protein [Terriglobia bacterium]
MVNTDLKSRQEVLTLEAKYQLYELSGWLEMLLGKLEPELATPKDRAMFLGDRVQACARYFEDVVRLEDVNFALGVRNAAVHPDRAERPPTALEKERASRYFLQAVERILEHPKIDKEFQRYFHCEPSGPAWQPADSSREPIPSVSPAPPAPDHHANILLSCILLGVLGVAGGLLSLVTAAFGPKSEVPPTYEQAYTAPVMPSAKREPLSIKQSWPYLPDNQNVNSSLSESPLMVNEDSFGGKWITFTGGQSGGPSRVPTGITWKAQEALYVATPQHISNFVVATLLPGKKDVVPHVTAPASAFVDLPVEPSHPYWPFVGCRVRRDESAVGEAELVFMVQFVSGTHSVRVQHSGGPVPAHLHSPGRKLTAVYGPKAAP